MRALCTKDCLLCMACMCLYLFYRLHCMLQMTMLLLKRTAVHTSTPHLLLCSPMSQSTTPKRCPEILWLCRLLYIYVATQAFAACHACMLILQIQFALISWEGGEFDIPPTINASTGVLMFKSAPNYFSPPGQSTVVTVQARVINAEELTTFTETNTAVFKYVWRCMSLEFPFLSHTLWHGPAYACFSVTIPCSITIVDVNDAPSFNVTTSNPVVYKSGNMSYLVELPTDTLSMSVPFATAINPGNTYEVNQTVNFACNATDTVPSVSCWFVVSAAFACSSGC